MPSWKVILGEAQQIMNTPQGQIIKKKLWKAKEKEKEESESSDSEEETVKVNIDEFIDREYDFNREIRRAIT